MVEGIRDYSKCYDAENLIECYVSLDKSAVQISARSDHGKWSKNRCKVFQATKQDCNQASKQTMQLKIKEVTRKP